MHRINRFTYRNRTLFSYLLSITLPLVCIVLLLSQTAFAQNTYVITDGNRVLVHTTYATDPAAVLNEAGLELGADDTYVAQKENGVSEIWVQRVQTVNIDHCGEAMVAGSYGETVGELLSRLNVDMGGDTVVSAPLDSETYDGMQIKVSRTVTNEETYTRMVPSQIVYCEDAALPEGEQKTLVQGQSGEEVVTDRVTYKNGKETNRVVLDRRVTVQPVDTIVAVGKSGAEEHTAKETQNSRMPEIGDGIITLPTGEVLTYTGVKDMVATGYNKANEGCNDWTATGTPARVGAIAVDPSVIPYGTRMFILSKDHEYVYGVATAEDCGGDIENNRIDLYFDTNSECFQFGVRDCWVYILE